MTLGVDCVHVWGRAARCEMCDAKRCGKWRCDSARLPGASRCADHQRGGARAGAADDLVAPALTGRPIVSLTYSWPGGTRR
jgi:hypothetical protein